MNLKKIVAVLSCHYFLISRVSQKIILLIVVQGTKVSIIVVLLYIHWYLCNLINLNFKKYGNFLQKPSNRDVVK